MRIIEILLIHELEVNPAAISSVCNSRVRDTSDAPFASEEIKVLSSLGDPSILEDVLDSTSRQSELHKKRERELTITSAP